MTRLQGVNFQCHITSPSPNILIKRKIGVVLTADEQQEFSMVYFEIKKPYMTSSPMNLFRRGLATSLTAAGKLLRLYENAKSQHI